MLLRSIAVLLSLGVCLLMPAASRAQNSAYPPADFTVARSWPIGGTGTFDALAFESGSGRLYIARTERVDVIDTTTGKVAGNIPRTPGVHAVAFVPSLKRGFTSNGRSNTVSVFELDSLHVIQEIPIQGVSPDAIVYEPQRNLVFTANRESTDLSVIDAGSMQVVGRIPMPGTPESMATNGAGTVFVNINGAPGKLVAVNAKTLKVQATWNLKGCANPTGLAIDPGNYRLFSVCANQVMAVTDSQKGRPSARIVIGRGSDGVGFDADLGLVFSSNGIDGTLTVIQQDTPDDYRVLATVSTQVSARTLAIDVATHRLFLPAAQFGPTPEPTAEQPQPHATLIPGSFVILVAQPK